MKKSLLSLLFILSSAYAQDCIHCRTPDFWSWLFGFQPTEWPVEFIKVEKVDYETNSEATYCKRPEDMVDTIVLHHSETTSTWSPQDINRVHLNRGTPDDPWYMIGYSYVVNTPYPGASLPRARVTEGRPMDIVGAHAGSYAWSQMDDDQKRMWEEGKVVCGNDEIGFSVNPKLVQDGRIKANVTTLGLVVIGNYAPFSRSNPNGYSRSRPRYPTAATLDMVARMSCQLQKKWPRIKNIKWHNYYHDTTCPGNLKNYIGQIKAKARGYGCEFN